MPVQTHEISAAGDHRLMMRALELARRGLFTTTPNPRVGCVIARDGTVLGEGWHERAGEAHAEVRALQSARALGHDVRGAVAYVTLEPCNHHGRTPPCTRALTDAGIGRVVAAMKDPDPVAAHGADRLEAAGVQVDMGLLEDEARDLNCGWIKRVERGMPWVRVKIAASIDGRTALHNGSSQWITGEAARNDGHFWRARACAILTGIGTVLHDDPRLSVRAVETTRQPIKVIVDRNGDLPHTARLLDGAEVIVVTAVPPRKPWPDNVSTLILPDAGGRIDLPAMLSALSAREINEIHVEAGAKLNGALLSAGLVDEVLLYLAPCVLGEPARGMFDLPAPIADLSDRIALHVSSIEAVGEDWRILARPARGAG
jgi:diaminohydroxyphosphoribosylaminopyrimidine deaminase/5-amino-6-(5-phosphoribosylamino)uracil reductase